MIEHEYNILLVEDNYADRVILKKAINKCPYKCNLEFSEDGRDVCVNNTGYIADLDLVFLDLSLKTCSGLDFLQKLKQSYPCKPVVMLTSSNSKTDIEDCYSLGANAYITKQNDYDKFCQVIEYTLNFWLACNIHL